MNENKLICNIVTGAVLVSIGIMPAFADVKVRLKPNNDFKVEKRGDSTQKFAIKREGGLVFPLYAAHTDLVESIETGECYWNTTDSALYCAAGAATNGGTATWIGGGSGGSGGSGGGASGGSWAGGDVISATGRTWAASNSDASGNTWDGKFVTSGSPYDWLSTSDDALWQGSAGTNNVCGAGYSVPTEAELNAERLIFPTSNRAGAYASVLKMPRAGYRERSNGTLVNVGGDGYYWTSTVVAGTASARYLNNGNGLSFIFNITRGFGHSVRCIKDV